MGPVFQTYCFYAYPLEVHSCSKNKSPHAFLTTQHEFIHTQQAYQSTCFFCRPTMPSHLLLCLHSNDSFMVSNHAKPHASLPTQHTKADVSSPLSKHASMTGTHTKTCTSLVLPTKKYSVMTSKHTKPNACLPPTRHSFITSTRI